jgi:hypothetical protein
MKSVKNINKKYLKKKQKQKNKKKNLTGKSADKLEFKNN